MTITVSLFSDHCFHRDEDAEALRTQCLTRHTWRRRFDGISQRPSLLHTVRGVCIYRKEGVGVKPEEENRKPHLAAPFTTRKVRDRLSLLAKPRRPTVRRDKK